MKIIILIFILLGLTLSSNLRSNSFFQFKPIEKINRKCHIHNPNAQPVIKTELSLIPKDQLPTQWLWNDVDGVNYLTLSRNQHIPTYCGSCWAFSSTSAMSDRIKIMRKAQWPDINIAPQVLISCENPDLGCHGGDALTAYQYIHQYNITDETCSTYQARGHDNGVSCTDDIKCKNCMPGKGCFVPESYYIYTVDEFANIQGEETMMNEIYQRGPIVCSIAVTDALESYTGGIFNDTTGSTEQDHDISVVGYGEENGVKFWLVRNSWGTYWGEEGFFRIVRGTNNLGIESHCTYAVPKDTWTLGLKNHTNTSQSPLLLPTEERKHNCRKNYTDVKPLIKTPEPWTYLDNNSIPASWDWRNVNGTNFLSWSKNQHIPVYCGSCWAQATTSAMADRLNVQNKGKFPQVAIDPQVIINCNAGGSCEGGNPLGVYSFAHDSGVPDSTCQQYVAKDPSDFTCSDIQQCETCTWPPPPLGEQGNCSAVTKFKKIYVSEYGSISGADKMKAEIYARGPISCGIDVTDKFEDYAGGVYEEDKWFPMINHEISVLGWGVENGTEYWIARNSWGTYWGEYGFFRIRMHKYNLGIESDCSWGVPTYQKSE